MSLVTKLDELMCFPNYIYVCYLYRHCMILHIICINMRIYIYIQVIGISKVIYTIIKR